MKTNLDRDVNRSTAFNTFAELTASMARGYTPTVRGRTAAERRIRFALLAAGLRVWPEVVCRR